MASAHLPTDGELETRFAHLLRPIRDLAQNWNVDIASLLQGYLSELGMVTIGFANGQTTMNFAEAALLIQGSTCVYSKKVEFLYSIVQQLLQFLYSKKKLQQTPSLDENGRDKDTTSLEKNNSDEFLSLDDIATTKNLILNESHSKRKSLQFLPKTPTFFMPLDTNEKGDIILLTQSGEQIGYKNDFKMSVSSPDASGMLLFDTASKMNDDEEVAVVPMIPFPSQTVPAVDNFSRPPSPAVDNISVEDTDDGVPDCGADCGGSDVTVVQNPSAKKGSEKKYNLRQRQSPKKVDLDATALLEPSDPFKATTNDRIMRKGKPFRILSELAPENDRKTRKKRRSKASVGKKTMMKVGSFCTEEYLSDASKFNKDPLKVPTALELNKVYWQEVKERRRLCQEDSRTPSPDLEVDRLADDGCVGSFDDWLGGCDGDVNCHDDGDGTDDPRFAQPCELEDPCSAGGDAESQNNMIGGSYEDLVQYHVDKFMGKHKNTHTTELGMRVAEWEERISPKLQEEELRPAFDIHEYGDRVLNCFAQNNRKQTLPFSRIVNGMEKFQVARYFLASLQLANTYNVHVETDRTLLDGVNTMQLTLLSRKRHHEELDGYVAPNS